MDTTDVIAIAALVVSAISLTYAYVVDHRTPRLRVRAGIKAVATQVSPTRREHTGDYFMVDITNHGPGRSYVHGVGVRRRSKLLRWWRSIRGMDVQGYMLDTDINHPNPLPCWLDVGESATVVYPVDSEVIETDEFDDVMVWDSLGKTFSAQKHALRDARKSDLRAARIEAQKSKGI